MTFDASNPVPTAKAWQVQLFRDNSEAFEVGKRFGSQGRGSRARYRRAVLSFAKRCEFFAAAKRARSTYEAKARRLENAARRARTILARLDATRPT